MYTFDTASTVTVTNDTNGTKLKRLVGVNEKNYMHASIKRAYEQYHTQCCST